MRDLREVVCQNPEPYNSIYNFIRREIIPKYPCLTSVYQDNFDDEGNQTQRTQLIKNGVLVSYLVV